MKKILYLSAIMLLSVLNAQEKSIMTAGTEASSYIIKTNEDYISSIKRNIDLNNTLEVFEIVFNSLKPEVAVYPTENYYYYQFEISGRTIKGNIALFANDRDKGNLNFAFEEVSDMPVNSSDMIEGVATLNAKDGVNIQKVNSFEYIVTYKNRSVKFLLNKLDINQPNSLKLQKNETYVGNTFDESGLRFHLVYNSIYKNLFWVLNEEFFVPDNFAELIDNVIVGKRTGFIFFNDRTLGRKILFGVNHQNISLNNWFDGPFDQLPDNYIETGEVVLKEYIEESYPFCRDKIDKYGHFLNDNDTRVAISSYLAYNSYIDVLKVYYACKNSSNNSEEFIFNLTKERYFEPEE